MVAHRTGARAPEIKGPQVSIFRFGTVVKKLKIDNGESYIVIKEGDEAEDVMHNLPREVVHEVEEYFGVTLNTEGRPW